MKKMLLSTFALLTILSATAQTEAGSKFIGGTLSFRGTSSNQETSTNRFEQRENSFLLSPNFGYFVKDNLAIGATLTVGISGNSTRNENPNIPQSGPDNRIRQTSAGFGVFISPLYAISEKFYFTPVIAADYLFNYRKNTSYDYNGNGQLVNGGNVSIDHIGSVGLTVTPTLVYFATPRIGINLNFGSLYYRYSGTKRQTTAGAAPLRNHQYGLSIDGTGLSLGLNYFF